MSEVTQPSSGRALSRIYRVCGVVFGLGGVAVAVWEPFDSSSDVKYAPLVGISVFAVLYVIAQAVERLVEWVVDILTLLKGSPGQVKAETLRNIGNLDSTINGNPAVTNFDAVTQEKQTEEQKLDTAITDITFLAHGLSILLCACAVVALDYGLLESLGATGFAGWADRLVTALAAAGGSKGLHELIGRMEKTKEQAASAAKAA